MALLMILYPLTRWPIESLRADEIAVFGGMTLSQNISVGLLIMGLTFWAQFARRPAGRHVDNAGPSEQDGVLINTRSSGLDRVAA